MDVAAALALCMNANKFYEHYTKVKEYLVEPDPNQRHHLAEIYKYLDAKVNEIESNIANVLSDLTLSVYATDEREIKVALEDVKTAVLASDELTSKYPTEHWIEKAENLMNHLSHLLAGLSGTDGLASDILSVIKSQANGYAYRIHGSVKDLFTLINSGMAVYAFYANQALLSPNGDEAMRCLTKLYAAARERVITEEINCLRDFKGNASVIDELTAFPNSDDAEKLAADKILAWLSDKYCSDFDPEEQHRFPVVRWFILTAGLSSNGSSPIKDRIGMHGNLKDYSIFSSQYQDLFVLFYPFVDADPEPLNSTNKVLFEKFVRDWIFPLREFFFPTRRCRSELAAEQISKRLSEMTNCAAVVLQTGYRLAHPQRGIDIRVDQSDKIRIACSPSLQEPESLKFGYYTSYVLSSKHVPKN